MRCSALSSWCRRRRRRRRRRRLRRGKRGRTFSAVGNTRALARANLIRSLFRFASVVVVVVVVVVVAVVVVARARAYQPTFRAHPNRPPARPPALP
jgi:hypothetical protein